MSTFNKLLNEALENTSDVSLDEFLKFATAIVASTSADKIPLAIERAMALSLNELIQIIRQVEFTGDIQAFTNVFHSNPDYKKAFIELSEKVLPERGDSSALQFRIKMARMSLVTSTTFNLNKGFGTDDECRNCGVKLPIGGPAMASWLVTRPKLTCPQCKDEYFQCANCGGWSYGSDYKLESNECNECYYGMEKYNPDTDTHTRQY